MDNNGSKKLHIVFLTPKKVYHTLSMTDSSQNIFYINKDLVVGSTRY